MKYSKFLLLFLLFPMLSAVPAHKFYVSVTKIEYAKEKNSLQIITKIFIDDIEDALQKRYDPSLSLATDMETEAAEADLKKYILQKLKITINGSPVRLHYIGREYDPDMVVAYLEVTDVKSLKSIRVENKVLMELFPEQQNIVHIKTPQSRKSLILEKDEPSGELNF
ncbi:hypothetical protein F3C99_08590 [Vitellibacter sp. q18]|jgi:hypothetical protein|nr:hypothetical protein [Aequorivita lutea]